MCGTEAPDMIWNKVLPGIGNVAKFCHSPVTFHVVVKYL